MQPRPSLPAEVGTTLLGWLTGQAKIGAILACIYAVGFGLSGVPWWPLIALLGGVLQFVPVVGGTVTMLVAVAAAYFAGRYEYSWLGALGTYVAAQALEGFYLTPAILGRRLRMPPVAVFLAVLLGGMMFGPIGVIFAAPVLAVLLVFWRRRLPASSAPPPPPDPR